MVDKTNRYDWWNKFNAEPSRNHSIWGSPKVWFRLNDSLVPSEWLTVQGTGLPGASSFKPVRLIRSSSRIRSYSVRVAERQSQQALFLQVGLVDAGEAAGYDRTAAQQSRR